MISSTSTKTTPQTFRGLTFNLGLRYDRQLGAYGDYLNKDLTLTGHLLGAQAAEAPATVPFIDAGVRGNAKNFGPRVGFAWDPARDGRMNVHAGWGIYYDNMRTLQLGGEITWPQAQQIIISHPSYPDPLQGQSRSAFLSTAPPNIQILANDLRSPYSRSFTGGVTRELTHDVGIDADFRDSAGQGEPTKRTDRSRARPTVSLIPKADLRRIHLSH